MKNLESPYNGQIIPEIITYPGDIGFFSRLIIAFKAMKFVLAYLKNSPQQAKVHKLSVLRNESLSDTVLHTLTTGFNLIPTNLDRLDFATAKEDIVSSVERLTADVFKVQTTTGMTFYDWEGSIKHFRLFWLLSDKSKKKQYKNDSFFAASAVKRSYVNGTKRFPGDQYVPKEGGVVIEAGAYVGYKAVSFGQQVGPTGKVIAIETSPDNFELLQKNIAGNGLDQIVTPVHCAVWKEDGTMAMMSRARMKHTIVDTEELPFEPNDAIQAKSIDTIIDDFQLSHVDFLNLQLNGAEIEAILGLKKNLHKVKYINIISRHHRDGKLVVEQARKILEDLGCEVLVDSRTKRLYNLTVKVKH